MKFFLISIFLIFLNNSVFAELIKPSPNINPQDVITIQLDALTARLSQLLS